MTGTERHDAPDLAERVAAFARGRDGGGHGGAVERFVRHFYRRRASDGLAGRGVENLYASARDLFDFVTDRPPGTDKLRVRDADAAAASPLPHSAVELVTDDRPFIVDSVVAELNRQDVTIRLVAHPMYRVRRDAAGRLDDLRAHDGAGDEGAVESVMRIEIDRPESRADGDALASRLRHVLHDVRLAVADWEAMRDTLAGAGAEVARNAPPQCAGLDETAAFLRWLADRHFTYLGYRRYDLQADETGGRLAGAPGTALGLMRRAEESDNAAAAAGRPVTPEVLTRLRGPHPLIVSKSARRSTVHRPVPMDSIEVKRYDGAGNVVGVHRFLGLFTSRAHNRPPAEVPLLRRKIAAVRERAGFPSESHDDRALLHVLEALPRGELFQYDEDALLETGLGILDLHTRPRVRLFARRNAFEWAVSCLVFVPRERYAPGLRKLVSETLEAAFDGTCQAYFTQLGDDPLARLHVIVRTVPGRVPAFRTEEIEARLAAALSGWDDNLAAALAAAHDGDAAAALAGRYRAAFPLAYRERFAADAAADDIGRIEAARRGDGLALHLYNAAEGRARLKIYRCGDQLALSDVLPTLENMGLRVVDEFPYRLAGGETEVWIHDLGVRVAAGGEIHTALTGERLAAAFIRVWRGEAEDDAFNRLIVRAGLDWREVVVLRAYAKYLRQTKVAFSQAYMAQTLAANPGIVRRLVELFVARFDPAGTGDEAEAAAAAGVETALDAVAGLDEDRVIRRFLNAIQSTVRTNFFQRDRTGARHARLSLKIDSTRIHDLPPPRPAVEIFVYAARVEGVHLRGGEVARGGLRWSSRMEDYRTEILGLMKAQLVKNAVIVPVGAKGGFVVKRPPAGDRDALLAEAVSCYRTFVSGLLDVTDNLVDGKAVAPREVRRRDGDDPYLVVAADKGTATFSDIANGVAADYDFWLGDAFASGGSSGYDHKRMGITARGAWEAVKRHFRDMGRDTQTEPFTVVGIGDMSGDVFGNGVLLSRHIRLVGAFDHRHVFVDPGADAETGFAERQRLFGLARSSWADYDTRLISRGGGVFDRGAKSLALTPEIRILLDFDGETATPNELISALLAAPVDLLWNGGIGTYVKASDETHAEVGDRVNDGLRIDAAALRCKVVGEGGNLGLTQRARVEAARRGVRLNSDAIDNSAGVDCSDREVNIKILLRDVESAGSLTRADRDALLAEMTDAVAHRCLADNYRQALGIGVVESLGSGRIDLQQRMMQSLERAGELDRGVEALPDDEAMEALHAAGSGLTRPEISVLYAHAKIALYNALLESSLPDDEFLACDLEGYFPDVLVERYRPFIRRHRLRREIVATVVANSLVDRASMAFALLAREETGREAADVARAYVVARSAFGLPARWAEIESLDGRVPPAVQLETIAALRGVMEHSILWFLRHRQAQDCGATAALFGSGIAELAAGLDAVLPDDLRRTVGAAARGLSDKGVPRELARFTAAAARPLHAACAIVEAADLTDAPVLDAARAFFGIGRLLGLDWLRSEARSLATSTVWQRRAAAAVIDDLFGQQTTLTVRALESGGTAEDWAAANRGVVARASRLRDDLRSQPRFDLAMLAVASRQTRDLLRD